MTVHNWRVTTVSYDGSMYVDETPHPTPQMGQWMRIVELPTLVIDEWQGEVEEDYDHWTIYVKQP